MIFTDPSARQHAEAAAQSCANALQTDHMGESVWWLSIARQHAREAEQCQQDSEGGQ